MAILSGRPGAVHVAPTVRRWTAGVAAVALFPLAIHLLQTGAGTIAQPLHAHLAGASPASMIGVGWVASLFALSGSPVAAAALALFQHGALDELQCFAMVVGTRFGAIFVALALAALYALRPRATRPPIPPVESMSHDGGSSLAIGLLACLTTLVVGWLAAGLGLFVLPQRWFELTLPESLLRGLDRAANPLVQVLSAHIPGWLIFLLGLGGVLLSFKLIDLALPVARGEVQPRLQGRLTSPVLMFLIGLGLTLITPSVTVSVGVLVPLHARGYVRNARLVPYVLGANIAAFSDTLLAALMLGDARATNIVLTEIVSIATVSLALMAIGHDALERALIAASESLARSRRALLAFLAITLALPLALIFLS